MSATFTIATVQHSLMALKEKIAPEKWSETPLPVIAGPGWWMEEIRQELGAEAGLELAEIHSCAVMRNDNLSEPILIDHDGTRYPILPQWMRAKQAADKEEGEA